VRRTIRAVSVAVLAGLFAAPAGAANAVPLPPNTSASGQWWFVTWDIAKIWQLGAQGQGITVAVLDTGINPSVAGLSAVVGVGTDVTGGTGDGRQDTEPSGHGTRMAALIAGQREAVGVAPRARILPVTVNNGPGGDNEKLYSAGIRYAVEHGAKVINISQGEDGNALPGNCPGPVQAAVADAVRRGAIVVASAGNDGNGSNPAYYPAACKGVLSVGAIDLTTNVWTGSERQPYVDVAAPGVDIHSVDGRGGRYLSRGTSDAAALTSGAIALVWSKYPQLTNRQVLARVLATLRDDATAPGRDDQAGGGIVRPYRAIVGKIPGTAANPVFAELDTLPSPPPGGGAPGSGTPPPCNPPAPGAAQATVAPPPSGAPPGGGLGAPPCSGQSTAAPGGSSSHTVVFLLVGLGLLLIIGAVAVSVSRRGRGDRGGPRPPIKGPGPGWPSQPHGPSGA
jgi:subtilisin family serine protease